MKACWADYTELPMSCVLDDGNEYDCSYTCNQTVTIRDHCEHWNEQLAIDLCIEILGEGYEVRKK